MMKCPLAFEPGTGWTYGESIDWAGEVVRLSEETKSITDTTRFAV